MATVKWFYGDMYALPPKDRLSRTRSLVRMRAQGITYKLIGETLGYPPSQISKYLKVYERMYREEIASNFERLEKSLTTVDPDYAYMIDPRTVQQQMCALEIGREVFEDVLNQLANLPDTP